MDPAVADLRSVVQPPAASGIEVLPGVEFRRFEKIVPHQTEALLLLALSVRVGDVTGEGLKAVMTSKIQQSLVPQGVAVGGAVAGEHGGGHVVEDQAQSASVEVLEGHGQAFKQGVLALIGKKVEEELARRAQQTAQGVNQNDGARDGYPVGRPVDLHLFSWRRLETALDLLFGPQGQAGP